MQRELFPILKKGSNLDESNFRPVSTLPSVSHKFVRELVNQLYMYFNPIFPIYDYPVLESNIVAKL